ncbi:glutamate ABC transporter substrate-binding protein [Paractinoplanes globisporus]|uniref:Glutamate ABC transporter substrate-binding protein n=1 Tax=Paractinoplanes globisporus TaxID=113565 RepID=A0ABW6W3D7_9ACTN|nr:glutamate ABC transporter substrate-binding protein [Actinoplanes globisporus]
MNRLAVALAVVALLALPACDSPEFVDFPAGTTMHRLQHSGRIRIGVKADQPSLGFLNPATNQYEGFDVELATIVAAELGLSRKQITFVTTTSRVREDYLVQGRVDIVVASYSMSDRRRAVVGQAGPYFKTGQQLLVRRAEKNVITGPEKIRGGRVCSVSGSTSIDRWRQLYGTTPEIADNYTKCVQRLLTRSVDGVTTDGVVLLGYVAQLPTKLAVVGPEFSVDAYGIGYPKGDRALCDFLSGVITKVEHDGRWNKAFKETLGQAAVAAPPKPAVEPCRD